MSLFSCPADGLLAHSLLLDEERGRLLLGARDHIYLLDPNNPSKAPRKVYIQKCNNYIEIGERMIQTSRGNRADTERALRFGSI